MDDFDDLDLDFLRELSREDPPEDAPVEDAAPEDAASEPSVEEMFDLPPEAPVEEPPRPQPRVRKPINWKRFKRNYLPWLIVAAAVLLMLAFTIGAIHRSATMRKAKKDAADAESKAAAQLAEQYRTEAASLITQADALAAKYDFDGAIALMDSFSGSTTDFPEILTKRSEYAGMKDSMVAWSDPSQIPNLSFQLLIADPSRAFADDTYGEAYNRNYVTTDEFSKILQQLYDNGYMLVRLQDIAPATTNEDGTTAFSAATLYLPAGKKPLVLTQCAVNYFTYMTDGDGDGLPDKDGDGFASRLIVDENGKFSNEMIDAEGNLVTGAFDLVPILESFIAEHPDFSYRGARAVLAVTGYDGIFGYRIDADTQENTDGDYFQEQVSGAKAIVSALRDAGYELACYTYDHFSYGEETAARISEDLSDWSSEITPVLGDVGILVYPFGSDIAEYRAGSYSGDRYETLRDAGFRYFIGMDNSTPSWADVNGDYVRQTRRLVSGAYMAYSADLFADLFDAASVLNSQRGTVPQD